ncbi:hypothetical protein THTE_0934 [Thermogutta terrifontis]|uniref:Uncharacterized protein n=1 Tax=Thermogutta terrifontis TaxID=1331910 RepID=A0A286RC50_9BACT|nr:hypothetical protein THTE_0934 [Thermogutta terrifontis]
MGRFIGLLLDRASLLNAKDYLPTSQISSLIITAIYPATWVGNRFANSV